MFSYIKIDLLFSDGDVLDKLGPFLTYAYIEHLCISHKSGRSGILGTVSPKLDKMRMIVTCGLESCFEDSDLTADDLLDVDNLTCELFASFDPSLDSILSFGVGNIYGFNGEVFPLYTDDVVYEIGQAEKIARNLNPGRAENYEVTMQNGCKLHKQMCSESEFPLSVSILECINRFGNRKIVEVLGCNRELMLQYL